MRAGISSRRWALRMMAAGAGQALALPVMAAGAALGAVAARAQGEAEPVVYHVVVPVRGRVQGADETVLLTGLATIESTVIQAPNAPLVAEIATDFSAVMARGETTGNTYRLENPMRQQRRLSQTQQIDVSFPYYRETDPLSASSGHASFRLNATGKPLRAMVIGAPGGDESGQE